MRIIFNIGYNFENTLTFMTCSRHSKIYISPEATLYYDIVTHSYFGNWRTGKLADPEWQKFIDYFCPGPDRDPASVIMAEYKKL